MNNIPEKKNPERKFLHDLATPLGTAMLLTDIILEDIQTRADIDPEDVMKLGDIYKALEKIKSLIYERREILIKNEEVK